MKSVCLFLAVLCLLLVTPGCDDTTSSALIPPKLRMTVEASHLTPLENGFNYKAWAKVGDTYFGTELFNVTSTGQFTTSIGQFRDKSFVLEGDMTDAEMVLISIEGKIGNATSPSGTVILAADVSGASSSLTTAHPSALGSWLVSQSGKLTIMTPSDTDLTNESHGVWFFTVSGSAKTPGLSLPALSSGWEYEGWVEVGGAVLSTGRFTSNTGNDSNVYSFPDVPLFPGEDFLINPPNGITFPLNLDGANVSITAEPFPDDTFEPSGIKVLSAQLPSVATGGAVIDLTGTDSGFPTATISIF
ncbi:hypothetical protein HQ496_11065 [bacterium]|nr:hypothetical protein [bacterium]